MKTYTSKETVQAVKVGTLHGSLISGKASKERLYAGDKGVIDLGNTFVGQNKVKVGDYVLFHPSGVVSGVMSGKAFEAGYKAKKEAKAPTPTPAKK